LVDLFAKEDLSVFFDNIKNSIRDEINSLSDEKILNTDIEELYSYYFALNELKPLRLFLDNYTPVFSETKVQRYGGYRSSENQSFFYDGYQIKYEIPFDGDNRLLYRTPSSRFFLRFPVDHINNSTDSEYGKIIFSINWTKQEIDGIAAPDFEKKQLEQGFINYKTMVDNINNDVSSFNTSLHGIIKNALDNRKKKVEDFISLSEKLCIPININPNAPNTKPILLKKAIIKKPELPNTKPQEKEYYLSNENYENIKRIINMVGFSMEKTAKTFYKLDEEEIRDFFIAVFNTHYQCMTTGETFSKAGKTDIHIQFDNKAAYIAECKIWRGEKYLQEAIEQLFSYTTWRDIKTSIIIFNTENKDFNKLLTKINDSINKYELCKKNIQKTQNEWLCEFNKEKDTSIIMNVQIIAFDFFLNKDV